MGRRRKSRSLRFPAARFDVDGGTTTLVSPTIDASGLMVPYIAYWRWYSNTQGGAAGADIFVIDVSNDDGASWINLETVGPTGPDVIGGWIEHRVRISDLLTPTNQMRLRFVASDLGSGSIVEAAVDDVRILEYVCSVGIATINPGRGSLQGGNTVTITGEGFLDGTTTVHFGPKMSRSVNVLSDTLLKARVPRAARTTIGKRGRVPRTVDVTVTTGIGSATFPRAYTYELPTTTR